jgi:hypothetical protein
LTVTTAADASAFAAKQATGSRQVSTAADNEQSSQNAAAAAAQAAAAAAATAPHVMASSSSSGPLWRKKYRIADGHVVCIKQAA